MDYKSQAVQDISVSIHSIKDDGTDNTGDAANLSTIILDPAGNELVGTTDYTEATFTEIGTTGEYECLFLNGAATEVFTSVDQASPYRVILVTSTASIGSSGKDVKIVSQLIGEVSNEANRVATAAVAALEATSQSILAQVTGTGDRVIMIHVQDTVAAPIADVLVRIGTASDYTDPSGDAVFALDDGDYDVILRKDFVDFTVPEPLTVAGDSTHPYTGTLFAPAVPTQPGTCVVYGNVIDIGVDPVLGATIEIKETDSSTFSNAQKIVADKETTSDVNGYWQIEVIRSSGLVPSNSPYQVVIENGDGSFRRVETITVPDQDSAEYSTIIDS